MGAIRSVIVSVSGDISGLQQAMGNAQSVMENTGKKLAGIGGGLTAGLTLPIVGVGLAAVNMAQDVSNSTGKIQAGLGVTADEATKLTGVAKDIWKNGFGENVGEASAAVVLLKQNMKGISDVDLKTVAESAFTLKDAFGAEINETTKTASVMMKNFGITGQEAMDLIATGYQKGGDFSGELLDSLTEYAPQFKAMGLSAADGLGVLIKGAEAGAFNLDKVGDAVKEMMLRTTDGSKGSADAFNALGFNAEEMTKKFAQGGDTAKSAFQATLLAIASVKDPVKQQQLGVALLGTQYEDLKGTVINSMAAGIGSIKNVDGTTKKVGDALYNNLGAKFQGVGRQLQDALLPFGAIILNLANRVMPLLTNAIAFVTNALSGMSPTTQTIVVILGGLLAAIGPILVALGAMSSGFAVIAGVIATISAPILIVIGVIALLVAAFVYLWNTNEDFKNKILALWEVIKTSLSSVFDSIKIIAMAVFDALKAFWASWGSDITKFFSIIWDTITGVLKGAFKVLDGLFQVFAGLFTGNWTKMWEGLKLIFTGIFDEITAVFKGTANIFINILNGMINRINSINIDVPKVNIPGVGDFGGYTIGFPKVPNIPSFDVGTDYVPNDMLAMIHKGEKITPAKYNNNDKVNPINVTITGNNIASTYDIDNIAEQLVYKLRQKGAFVT